MALAMVVFLLVMRVTACIKPSVPEAAVNRAHSSSLVNTPYRREGPAAAGPLTYSLHSSIVPLSLRSQSAATGWDETTERVEGGEPPAEPQLQKKPNKKNIHEIQAGVTIDCVDDEVAEGTK